MMHRYGFALLCLLLFACSGSKYSTPEQRQRMKKFIYPQERWKKYNIRDYTYHFWYACPCSMAGEYEVTVVQDRVTAAKDVKRRQNVSDANLHYLPTLNTLFDTLATWGKEGATFTVIYDSTYGFPATLYTQEADTMKTVIEAQLVE